MSRILFLSVFFSWILFAPQPSSSGGDEERIVALENIWNQAQINHDATAMGARKLLKRNWRREWDSDPAPSNGFHYL
jgi:hypothetical protein